LSTGLRLTLHAVDIVRCANMKSGYVAIAGNDGHFVVTQLQSIARASIRLSREWRINYCKRAIRYHAALSLIIRDPGK